MESYRKRIVSKHLCIQIFIAVIYFSNQEIYVLHNDPFICIQSNDMHFSPVGNFRFSIVHKSESNSVNIGINTSVILS